MTRNELLTKTFDAIIALAKSNALTGKYDNMRFQLCKKDYKLFTEQEKALLYKTEKLSRHYVEDRGVQRAKLNNLLKQILVDEPDPNRYPPG